MLIELVSVLPFCTSNNPKVVICAHRRGKTIDSLHTAYTLLDSVVGG